MNNHISSNATGLASCSKFNPEYCMYKLPCGTCMMLKSVCPHIKNTVDGMQQKSFSLQELTLNTPAIDCLDVPESCRHCPNHPSNGGSGNCNCSLGDYKVTC